MSEEGTFFSFVHNFYNLKRIHVARCEMTGAWINLETRKLTPLPEKLIRPFKDTVKTATFKMLTAADTRAHGRIPQDLIPNS